VPAPTSSPQQDESEGRTKRRFWNFLNARIAEIKAAPRNYLCREPTPRESIGSCSSARGSEAIWKPHSRWISRLWIAIWPSLTRPSWGIAPGIVPDQIEAWGQEAKQELKIYRKKLPKDTYAKILRITCAIESTGTLP